MQNFIKQLTRNIKLGDATQIKLADEHHHLTVVYNELYNLALYKDVEATYYADSGYSDSESASNRAADEKSDLVLQAVYAKCSLNALHHRLEVHTFELAGLKAKREIAVERMRYYQARKASGHGGGLVSRLCAALRS